MVKIAKVRKGDIVACSFMDHTHATSNTEDQAYEFSVFGEVIRQSKVEIVIGFWVYADKGYKADDGDTNVTKHTIVRSAITKLVKLVPYKQQR